MVEAGRDHSISQKILYGLTCYLSCEEGNGKEIHSPILQKHLKVVEEGSGRLVVWQFVIRVIGLYNRKFIDIRVNTYYTTCVDVGNH